MLFQFLASSDLKLLCMLEFFLQTVSDCRNKMVRSVFLI